MLVWKNIFNLTFSFHSNVKGAGVAFNFILGKTNFRCKSENLISGLWFGQFAGFIQDVNNFNRKFSVYGTGAKG